MLRKLSTKQTLAAKLALRHVRDGPEKHYPKCNRLLPMVIVLGFLYLSIVAWLFCGLNNTATSPQNNMVDDTSNYLNLRFWHSPMSDKENKVVYVGMFGLGHRLSKLAAAYHLVQINQWPVTHLEVLWGKCENGTRSDLDIFSYLFGNNQIYLGVSNGGQKQTPHQTRECTTRTTDCYYQGKSLVIRNDVVGYYAGQSYKNAQIRVRQRHIQSWDTKFTSDFHLFRNLMMSFEHEHGDNLKSFQEGSKWHDHFVVGIHIRAGNGEQDHFEQSQRQIERNGDFFRNLVGTIRELLNDKVTNKAGKRPLVFLATDTATLVDELRQIFSEYHIPMVTLDQPRVEPNKGVSYSAWTSDSTNCLNGWLYSMMDMSLLAKANILIAARRSTFTQILPRALLLDGHDKHLFKHDSLFRFCEVGDTGENMDCFGDTKSWLFRDAVPTPKTGAPNSASPSMKTYGLRNLTATASVHKLMVHLPDISNGSKRIGGDDDGAYWSEQARNFFAQSQGANHRLLFGFKIDKKYRQFRTFQSAWTLAP